MAPRKTSGTAIDNTPAADTASVPIVEGTDIPTNIESTANGTVEVATAAMLPEAVTVANIETALNVLTADNPARAALVAALETARGALALAEAEVVLQAQKTAEIAAATAAAASLPAELLAAMLAAIETKYAPVPPQAPEAEVAAPAPYVGRKPIGPRTAERNAQALAQAEADPTVYARAAAAYTAFRKEWSGDLRGVSAVAGTRYVSIVAFAGAGVANKSDYQALVPVMRRYLLSVGLKDGGESAATDAWLFAFGPHAAGAPKGADTLALKFLSGAGVALYSDGRFRLAARGTAGVKFVSTDAAALAAWNGSTQAPAQAAEVATSAAPAAPSAPTPPAAQALPNGTIASTARCKECHAKNIVGMPECNACGAADWQVA
jgi:hypothetical protein